MIHPVEPLLRIARPVQREQVFTDDQSVIRIVNEFGPGVLHPVKENHLCAIRGEHVKRAALSLNHTMLLRDRIIIDTPVAICSTANLERGLIHDAVRS